MDSLSRSRAFDGAGRAIYTSRMNDLPRILIVEDDRKLAAMIVELLAEEGYDVTRASDGQSALHLGLTQKFDVLLLDRGLPVIEGLDLLGRLRRNGIVTPALILSALGNPSDRVEGLDAGAEDYLAKPFDVDELLARLRALRRRNSSTTPVLPIPGGDLDVSSRTAMLGGMPVLLSAREGALLERLARWPKKVFPRQDLLSTVFPDADDIGVVDTYVHYLRKKLGRHVVQTVRGIGYRLGGMP